MHRIASIAAVTLLVVAACENGTRAGMDDQAANGGTIVISSAGEPDVLFPPLIATVTAKQVADLVYDHLAEVSDSLNVVGDHGFQPRLAKTWTWSPDSLSIQFHLDPAAKWHDGKPVRSSDVVSTYALYKDSATASPTAGLISDIDSVTAPDSMTAVFWYHERSPTQFFEAVNPMVILPGHVVANVKGKDLKAQSFARNPIGSGRFRFVNWNAGQSIELAADTANYRGRPHFDRVIMSFSPDPNTAFTRVLGGQADMIEQVSPPQMQQLAAHKEIRVVLVPGLDYNFIAFNTRNALFADRNVRRALTMAIDRTRIVQSVYDSLAAPAVGPTVRAYPTTDTTLKQIAYSPENAARLLDSAGWRVTGRDSVRRKNGKALEFTLGVPGSSRNRVNMAVIIQNQLQQIGVKMNIEKLDFAAFIDRETRHTFDAVMGGWHVDASPGGIRQTWVTPGTNTGGTNYGAYSNPTFDAQVDSALSALDLADRRARFKRAYQTMIDDAPAIWLAEPKTTLAIQSRIHTAPLRADAWWATLPDWYVPTSARIARDSAGTH